MKIRNQLERFLFILVLNLAGAILVCAGQSGSSPNAALQNGHWFNGRGFVDATFYCVDGFYTKTRPQRIDTIIDLTGLYIVPPFAEAHNHNINGGNRNNHKAIDKYLHDGVFYVKLPGNFYIGKEEQLQLGINTPASIDVAMSQGASFTCTGGHPYTLAEDVWLKFGYARGPVDSLNGRRFFTIDSKEEIDYKWKEAIRQQPDFIKTILWHSDEYNHRKGNKAFYGQSGLNPEWLPAIVSRAHAAALRVSSHVNNAFDFHVAVIAGVDEINHLPLTGLQPISKQDACLAAQRAVVVVTTCSAVLSLPPGIVPKEKLEQLLQIQRINLELLRDNGVTIAIGSDNPLDSSVEEFELLRRLGIFDNASLLKMWTENTPATIFPARKIGRLAQGYEASFLALEGNPLEDLSNVRKIKLRYKQGNLLR